MYLYNILKLSFLCICYVADTLNIQSIIIDLPGKAVILLHSFKSKRIQMIRLSTQRSISSNNEVTGCVAPGRESCLL